MLTQNRKRYGWLVPLGLGVVLFAPLPAEAQQGGLFPLSPIRRERVPCAAEDPVYKLYRHEYFGYHPTCWRRFPSGWGCPSPEAPNAAAAFRDFPRDKPPTEPAAEDGAKEPPTEGSGMRPGPTPPNPTDLPLPSGDTSPFDLDTKPSPMTPKPATPPPAGPTGAAGPRSGDEPLLGLPDPDAPKPGAAASKPGETALPGASASDVSASSPNAPFLAPRRQSLLTSLFGGRSFRKRTVAGN